MMRTRMIKLIGLGVILVATALLLVNTPVQAKPQAPAPDKLIQNAPAHPQPPPVEEVLQPAIPAAASVVFDLCASDGSITLPDSSTVAVWGFVDTGGGSCATDLVTSLPGPELRVNAGDTVTINLSNALAENVSILIPGQSLAATGGTSGLFATEAAPGGMVSYNFTAQEGTYLYESGTNNSIQIPMGLYGALIVNSTTSGQAYGNAFEQEAVLLLSEIDPDLNDDPGGFNLLDYHPTYWLINGAAYPDIPAIVANPGERVLLRYLNAGFDHPSMTLLGGYQEVIAKDAFELNNSFDAVAETIPAGTTADMIVDTTGLQGDLALYNRNMYVTNGNAYPGGMLTFLNLSAPTGTPPTVAMVVPADGATITGDMVLVQIDASDVEDDANLGAGNLSVNWDVDGGTPQVAAYNGVSGYYEAILDTTALSDGAHIINASVTDSDNNIVYVSSNVSVDNGAPVDNPPTVNAGVDQTITLPDAATLDGTVTDDGPSPLSTLWTQTSGPGTTTFGDASQVDTTASFSVDGIYVLRLTATDGTGSVFDEVTVTVNPVSEITIHIGDLDDASAAAGGPNWNAQVVITVHAVDESPVNGATVTVNATRIRKSNGSQPVSTLTCVTAAGQCTVTQSVNSNQFENSVTFTVTNVTNSAPYDPALNHDPDGDSDGFTIVVANPG